MRHSRFDQKVLCTLHCFLVSAPPVSQILQVRSTRPKGSFPELGRVWAVVPGMMSFPPGNKACNRIVPVFWTPTAVKKRHWPLLSQVHASGGSFLNGNRWTTAWTWKIPVYVVEESLDCQIEFNWHSNKYLQALLHCRISYCAVGGACGFQISLYQVALMSRVPQGRAWLQGTLFENRKEPAWAANGGQP